MGIKEIYKAAFVINDELLACKTYGTKFTMPSSLVGKICIHINWLVNYRFYHPKQGEHVSYLPPGKARQGMCGHGVMRMASSRCYRKTMGFDHE